MDRQDFILDCIKAYMTNVNFAPGMIDEHLLKALGDAYDKTLPEAPAKKGGE